jgi:L-ascorbate metabolism protein UlaG (beta-lactamase superfamily)
LKHADIYLSITPVENTGYLIAERFFYPGDAFTDPERSIDILALPVAGPWMKISEAIDYAKKLKPKTAFPVHDGMFVPGRGNIAHNLPKQELEKVGIKFISIQEGESLEV